VAIIGGLAVYAGPNILVNLPVSGSRCPVLGGFLQ
jgi:hypothetical protein